MPGQRRQGFPDLRLEPAFAFGDLRGGLAGSSIREGLQLLAEPLQLAFEAGFRLLRSCPAAAGTGGQPEGQQQGELGSRIHAAGFQAPAFKPWTSRRQRIFRLGSPPAGR
jgi:hypothetical protein